MKVVQTLDERARKQPELDDCRALFDTPEGRAKLRAGYATQVRAPPPGVPWAENDALFERELRAGFHWQTVVADHLRASGCVVVESVIDDAGGRVAGKSARFKDTADLLVDGLVVEVKSRRRRFTGPHDFPFPTVIVDTCESWEAKTRKPVAYVFVSQFTQGLMWCAADTRPLWTRAEQYDTVRRMLCENFVVPVSACQPMATLLERFRRRRERRG